jgi:hypothetical protein
MSKQVGLPGARPGTLGQCRASMVRSLNPGRWRRLCVRRGRVGAEKAHCRLANAECEWHSGVRGLAAGPGHHGVVGRSHGRRWVNWHLLLVF